MDGRDVTLAPRVLELGNAYLACPSAVRRRAKRLTAERRSCDGRASTTTMAAPSWEISRHTYPRGD
ncbi:hypothetical protein ACWDRX_35150, partial [Streptomyces nigra]